MATLTSPTGKGVVEVNDERVEDFLAAGWTRAKSNTKSETRRSTSKSTEGSSDK